MRLFRNILLLLLPLAIIISLYAFFFKGQDYEFRGMSYLFSNIETFPGLDFFVKTIRLVGDFATEFGRYAQEGDVLNVVFNFFKMVGMFFFVPISIVVCVVQNLLWFVTLIYG